MSYKSSFLSDNLDFKSLKVNDEDATNNNNNTRSLIEALNREFISFGFDSILDSNISINSNNDSTSSSFYSRSLPSSLNLNALLRNALGLAEKHKRNLIQLEHEKQKSFKLTKENDLFQRRQTTLKEDSETSHRDHLIMEEKMKLLESKLNAMNKLNRESNEEVRFFIANSIF